MFELLDVFYAYVVLGILFLIGTFIKQKVKLFQKLYLPESIITGAIALILGREILGAIANTFNINSLTEGLFSATIFNVWQQSPGVFINIVFAALFLGEEIPNPKDIWQKTAPQVAFGQSLAWGQYTIAIALVTFVLVPIFQINPLAGTLIEIAFEGGHGTAAGMAATLNRLGFPDGGDLALGLATVGIITGIAGGTLLIQWGGKQGHLRANLPENLASLEISETASQDTKLENTAIDSLTINFSFIALAIAIGWLILQGLAVLESLSWGKNGLSLIDAVPLFPMALIGGIIIQVMLEYLGWEIFIDRQLQEKIAGLAIDIVIATAIAAIELTVLSNNIGVFLSLAAAGIIWNLAAFIYLAPRIIPVCWFERGLGDMGQSMGVTATGILLIRMVDPDNKSAAMTSFAYKQLFFEPIVGGGLFTAAAPVLISQFGSLPVLILTASLLIFWLVFGIVNCQRTKQLSQTDIIP